MGLFLILSITKLSFVIFNVYMLWYFVLLHWMSFAECLCWMSSLCWTLLSVVILCVIITRVVAPSVLQQNPDNWTSKSLFTIISFTSINISSSSSNKLWTMLQNVLQLQVTPFHNKLERLSLASLSSLAQCSWVRTGAYPRAEHLKDASLG